MHPIKTIGKLRRSFLSDRLELRLLLVAQRSMEALKRGAHQMDRLLHGGEPPVHCVKTSGQRDRVSGWQSDVRISTALALASCSTLRAARCVSFGRSLASISSAGHCNAAGCAAPHLSGRQFRGPVCGGLLAPILRECIEPGFLFVFQQVIEFHQRLLYGQRCLHHRPDALLHDGQRPGAVNAACAGHDARIIWAAEINALARSSKAARCASFGCIASSNLIDGEAGNFASVIAAELRQPRDPARSSAVRARSRIGGELPHEP